MQTIVYNHTHISIVSLNYPTNGLTDLHRPQTISLYSEQPESIRPLDTKLTKIRTKVCHLCRSVPALRPVCCKSECCNSLIHYLVRSGLCFSMYLN